MAVKTDEDKLVIDSDGQSDLLLLTQVSYKVFVKYGSGASGVLTFQMGGREDELIDVSVPDGAGGLEATTSADKVFEMTGGGFFGVSASSVVGEITIVLTELLP